MRLTAITGLSAAPVLAALLALATVTEFDVFGLLRDEVLSAVDFGTDTQLNPSGANAQFRLVILAEGAARFAAAPVVGEGFGSVGFVHERGTELVETSFHNSHLAILVRTGLVGYAAFLFLLIVWWRFCSGTVRGSAHEPDVRAVKAIVVYMLVSFSFFHALEAPYVGPFFWLILGLGVTLASFSRDEGVLPD